MRSLASIIGTLAVASTLGGCALHVSRAEMQAKLRTHAASELESPADKLNVYEMTDAVSQVDGCGRKKSYIGVCAHFECKWIDNDGETVARFFKENTRPITTTTSNAPQWRPPAR